MVSERLIYFFLLTNRRFFMLNLIYTFSESSSGRSKERIPRKMGEACSGVLLVDVEFFLEHGHSGFIRPNQNVRHWVFRTRDASPAQSQQGVLCYEDFRQTKGF